MEDRILALQERKRQLADSALNGGAGQGGQRLTMQDLLFLFG